MLESTPMQIWYATEARARTFLKFISYDDQGILRIQEGALWFEGQKSHFPITKVEDVQLTTQVMNWVFQIPIAAFVFYGLRSSGVHGFAAIFMACIPVWIGVLINRATKWIRMTFETEDGRTAVAWFASADHLGWSGAFGRTRILYEALREKNFDFAQIAEEGFESEPSVERPRQPVTEECPWCEKSVIPNEDRRCPACDRPI